MSIFIHQVFIKIWTGIFGHREEYHNLESQSEIGT